MILAWVAYWKTLFIVQLYKETVEKLPLVITIKNIQGLLKIFEEGPYADMSVTTDMMQIPQHPIYYIYALYTQYASLHLMYYNIWHLT